MSLRKAAITARCAVPGELSGRRGVATLVRSFPVAVAFPFIAASLRRSVEVFNDRVRVQPKTVFREKVTKMFLLLVFTGLEHEQYRSHAYRTEQPWVARDAIRQAFWRRKQPDGNVRHPAPGRLRDPSPQGPRRL